jgi:hypothetical protein
MFQGRSAALAAACVALLARGSTTASPQVSIDTANRYSNVGAVMVWRVDAAGKPVELRGFASGTLIRDRVMVTAGHFTAPANALGTLPPSIRIFASFSAVDAKDPESWIPVVGQATHPSMPWCPPPPQCDPTDELLVAPLQPGIADVGLVFLAQSPKGITPARLADHGLLDRSEGASTTIVGYGTTSPGPRKPPIDPASWDGKRRFRASTLRKIVDETWGLWSLPSYVCHGDSGGAIFLNHTSKVGNGEVLAANVSDGGLDCRSHNNNNRLDTRSVQQWINDTIEQRSRPGGVDRAAVTAPLAQPAYASPPDRSPEPLPSPIFQVGGDVKAPFLIVRKDPQVAPGVRCRGLVLLEAIVDDTGKPMAVKDVTPSPDAFTAAYADSVKGWRFRPATRHGKAVAVRIRFSTNIRCA